MAQPKVNYVLTLSVLTAVYFAAGRFGLSLAFVNQSASAVWPPTGIALAALLILGLRAWPAMFAGAFLVNLATSGAVVPSLFIALGNTLEGVAAAWLVMRCAGGRAAFDRVATIVRFTLLAAIGAPMIAASIGAATLLASGLATPQDAGSIWLTWWLGDSVGTIVVTPLILLWTRGPDPTWTPSRGVEALGLGLCLVVLSLVVFGPSLGGRGGYPLQFFAGPVLLWAAFRFGARETATAAALMSALAIDGTLRGFGPFAIGSPNESLLLLQSFIGVTTIVMLAVAAEVAARHASEAESRSLNDALERRVAERTEELRRVNDRLVEAQQVAYVGSWEWDVPSNTLWWSDELCRLYGMDAAAYEGFISCVHPDDRAFVDEVVRRAIVDGKPFAFDHRVTTPNGRERVLHGRGRVEKDATGRTVRMVGTGHDITDRTRAEEERAQLIGEQAARQEAEEANSAKDQFLAMLSHELRTPLNVALGWAQMLRDVPHDAMRSRRAIEAIYRNLVVEARLVSDIMDISRITKGTLPLEKAPVDVPAVVEGALETVHAAAAARGVTLDVRVGPEAFDLAGDAGRLQQVLWNLVCNAVKFAREGGRVEVSVRNLPGVVEVVVEDGGPGIDPAFLPHMFEQFRQADASTTREHGGLGLGLAIARHIVEQHGGTITAANRASRGAVFTVRLPSAQTVSVG